MWFCESQKWRNEIFNKIPTTMLNNLIFIFKFTWTCPHHSFLLSLYLNKHWTKALITIHSIHTRACKYIEIYFNNNNKNAPIIIWSVAIQPSSLSWPKGRKKKEKIKESTEIDEKKIKKRKMSPKCRQDFFLRLTIYIPFRQHLPFILSWSQRHQFLSFTTTTRLYACLLVLMLVSLAY